MSIVHKHRKALEKAGEYVIRANASNGWFAVFPKKVEACKLQAPSQLRADFNFVIYRTVGRDEKRRIGVGPIIERIDRRSLLAPLISAVSNNHSETGFSIIGPTHFHAFFQSHAQFGDPEPLGTRTLPHQRIPVLSATNENAVVHRA